jgi:hypothetical protein
MMTSVLRDIMNCSGGTYAGGDCGIRRGNILEKGPRFFREATIIMGGEKVVEAGKSQSLPETILGWLDLESIANFASDPVGHY